MVVDQFRHLQTIYKFTIVNGDRPPDVINRELQRKIQSIVAGR
jgi:hypothetical protein